MSSWCVCVCMYCYIYFIFVHVNEVQENVLLAKILLLKTEKKRSEGTIWFLLWKKNVIPTESQQLNYTLFSKRSFAIGCWWKLCALTKFRDLLAAIWIKTKNRNKNMRKENEWYKIAQIKWEFEYGALTCEFFYRSDFLVISVINCFYASLYCFNANAHKCLTRYKFKIESLRHARVAFVYCHPKIMFWLLIRRKSNVVEHF